MRYFLIYLAAVNLFGMTVTIHDKNAAIRHTRRVPERTLMLLSALGAAPLIYLTMLIISHKTRKPLFMIGIPVIFIVELAVAGIILHYVFKII